MQNNTSSLVIAISNQAFTTELLWDQDVITIGRGKKNNIPLSSPDKKLSRDHLRLERREGDALYVIDLDSRNGTLVNETKLVAREPYQLTTEDKILAGDYTIALRDSSTSRAIEDPEDPTAEYQMTNILSVTALARREKLAVLAMSESGAWGDKSEKSRGGLYMVAISLFILGIVVAIQLNLFLHIKTPEKSEAQQSQQTTSPTNNQLTTVSVFTILAPNDQQEFILNAVGYVYAREVIIKSLLDGKIEFITASEGQKVEKDKILAKLDQSDTKVNLDLAYTNLRSAQSHHREIESQLKQAENKYIRQQKLHKQGLISNNELEEHKANFETLRFRVKRFRHEIETHEHKIKLLQNELEKAIIRAPFDGVITKKLVEVGFVVSTEDDMFKLMDRSQMGVEVDINEAYTAKISKRQEVEMTLIAYPDKKYQGRVRKISPDANRLKATVKVDIAFADLDEQVLPNMGVKVAFHQDHSKEDQWKITIPLSAIVATEKGNWVWLAVEGRIVKREVVVGERQGGSIEINAGLVPGDRVVTSPSADLYDNQQVNIR